ncbi:MAG: 30S ribosomal protein S1 [Deltaproteobacteria bacterium]|nr:30S ribosomal protein S1 [Deltaproteobacteria bacterium]
MVVAVRDEERDTEKRSDFAQLLEQSFGMSPVEEGEIVKGTIVGITNDMVIVDIGFKSEGQISASEFRNPKGEMTHKVGDVVNVFVEEVENASGLVGLSRERAEMVQTWDHLVEASEKDVTVEGTVVGKVKGGLSVDIGVKAFLPGSQVDIRPGRSLDSYIGETFAFKIIKLNKKRGNVVVSRKVVLEKERERLKHEVLANLQEGQILDGMVKNLTDYGAFVDLGGLDGLLHITDMSWGRINHPSELFSVGQTIRVKVLKYDEKSERVSLGYKHLQQDPWSGVEERYAVGARVTGRIVNITDYGAFVELEPGVEGLVHISEMSWSKKIKHPSKIVAVGQSVDAVILDIDPDNKRIALGLKQLLENPWDLLREQFSLGARVSGTVKNIADFGLFVEVGCEIDALAHISDLCWVQTFDSPAEVFHKGDQVEGVVLQIDPENERFAIGLKQLLDDPWEIIERKYPVGGTAQGRVVRLSKIGAVVELEPGVQGVIPRQDLAEEPPIGTEYPALVVSHADPRERRFFVKPQGV